MCTATRTPCPQHLLPPMAISPTLPWLAAWPAPQVRVAAAAAHAAEPLGCPACQVTQLALPSWLDPGTFGLNVPMDCTPSVAGYQSAADRYILWTRRDEIGAGSACASVLCVASESSFGLHLGGHPHAPN